MFAGCVQMDITAIPGFRAGDGSGLGGGKIVKVLKKIYAGLAAILSDGRITRR
jgi:hypothetical protein